MRRHFPTIVPAACVSGREENAVAATMWKNMTPPSHSTTRSRIKARKRVFMRGLLSLFILYPIDTGSANQALDPLCNGRVRGEEIGEVAGTHQRLHYKQMSIGRRGCHRQAPGIGFELFKRAGERIGIASNVRAGRVGLIFA